MTRSEATIGATICLRALEKINARAIGFDNKIVRARRASLRRKIERALAKLELYLMAS